MTMRRTRKKVQTKTPPKTRKSPCSRKRMRHLLKTPPKKMRMRHPMACNRWKDLIMLSMAVLETESEEVSFLQEEDEEDEEDMDQEEDEDEASVEDSAEDEEESLLQEEDDDMQAPMEGSDNALYGGAAGDADSESDAALYGTATEG